MELLDPKKVKYIIVHCSDSRVDAGITAVDIKRWHVARGFETIGYHYVINPDGSIAFCRSTQFVGAHAVGFNHSSIGVCYIGGRDSQNLLADTRTYAQKVSLLYTFLLIFHEFPHIEGILGHNDVSVKFCPCFNAKEEYKDVLSYFANFPKPIK